MTTTAIINVLPATPVITWTNPADIVYGTPLSRQLDATASTPGTFTYTPAAGTILNAGAAQTLSVNFVPDDTADYGDNTSTASVFDQRGAGAPDGHRQRCDQDYGQANPAFSVSFGGFGGGDTPSVLGGAIAFSTSATPTSDVGTYDVTASGLTSSNYTISLSPGTLSITPADQTITWANPADIVYGTPLDATQLDATVSGSVRPRPGDSPIPRRTGPPRCG